MTPNQLPILREENVQLIVRTGPETYRSNALSAQKCTQFGQSLLSEIEKSGMTDDLDKRCADYIEKARKTLRAMNERRSPITKIFDQIRSEFTAMENQVDPAKNGTVPFLIQQSRNTYAAKKRQEAERLRQEELRKQQHQQAIANYRSQIEDDIRLQFNDLVVKDLDFISSLNQNLTTDNYTTSLMQLKAVSANLGKDWITSLQNRVPRPPVISEDDANGIKTEVITRIFPSLQQQYAAEIGEYKDSLLDILPSKYAELEKIAKANAAEKIKMAAELKEKEAAELRRLDEERKRKDQDAMAAKAVQQSANEMDGLFARNVVAVPAGYQPKTSVKKKIVADSPDGILAILSMWWSKEGQFLPVEELTKIFRKQITFCEKVANDKTNPEFISSPFLRYEEEVKAK